MTKSIAPQNHKFQKTSDAPLAAADEAKAYRDDPLSRYAPYDNLWDAIRADVAPLGGVDLEPLMRVSDQELPFSDLDEEWFDDESYKDE